MPRSWLLWLPLLACRPTDPPVDRAPPPVSWQINLNNARGMGAAFDVGDLDRDGFADLAFAAPGEYGAQVYGLQVWLGVGGSFYFDEATTGPVNPTQAGTAVAICDLNGDGWSEIAVGEPEGPDCGLGAAPTCPADTRRGRIALYPYDHNGLGRTPTLELLGAHADDQLGLRVLCPGDVDHDGYDDLVTTAPRARDAMGGEGLVLLYRGSAAGLITTPAWSAGQEGAWAAEGEALVVADMNRDGWLDVLTGAPEWDDVWSDEGRVALYLNGPTGLSAAPSRVWFGGVSQGRFGNAVAAGEDVNGDGHAELLVGAPRADAPETFEAGQVLLFAGTAAGPEATAMWSWQGQLLRERLGNVVAMADEDGDGMAEVLVGSNLTRGRVASLSGSPAGPELTRVVWREGTSAHARVGSKVADVGDLDGDGLHDLMTGLVEPGSGQFAGIAVIPGRSVGWDGDSDGVPERSDCDDDNPAVGLRAAEVVGDQVDGDCDGRELCRADRDLDGHAAWFLVSADSDCNDLDESRTLNLPVDDCDDQAPDRYPAAAELPSDGRLQACSSSTACFVDADGDGFAADRQTVASADGDCDDPGEAPDARQIWALRLRSEEFGRFLSAAGDLDGDGEFELISEGSRAGRPGFYIVQAGRAPTWVPEVAGPKNGAAVGDLDGDGIADLVWFGGLHRTRNANAFVTTLSVLRGGSTGLQLRPWVSLAEWGDTTAEVEVAPDVDGDGYADLVVGRSGLSVEPMGTAQVHVLRGGLAGPDRASGWALTDLVNLAAPPPMICGDFDHDGLTDLFVRHYSVRGGPSQISVYGGTPAGPQLLPGWPSVSPGISIDGQPLAVGDFDADGYDDVALVTTCASNLACLDVFYGSPVGLPHTADLHVRYSDLPGGHSHQAVAAPGDVDGDGFEDLVFSTWDLSTKELLVMFGSARGLLQTTASRGLESLLVYNVQPAGVTAAGAAVWALGSDLGGAYAARIDVRWMVPDCDDQDPSTHAAAWDAPGDGVDADCDGFDTCWFDQDGDCLRDPSDRVTPDVSGRCDGPREAPMGAAIDLDDQRPTPPVPAAGLAVAGRRCAVPLTSPVR